MANTHYKPVTTVTFIKTINCLQNVYKLYSKLHTWSVSMVQYEYNLKMRKTCFEQYVGFTVNFKSPFSKSKKTT